MLGLGLGLNKGVVPVSYNPAAKTYFTAVPTAYSTSQKSCFNKAFNSLQANSNNWQYLLGAYKYANGQARNNGYINLVNPGVLTQTEVNSGDLSWDNALGIQSGGTNGFLQSNFIPSSFPSLANNTCLFWKVTQANNALVGYPEDWGANDVLYQSIGISQDTTGRAYISLFCTLPGAGQLDVFDPVGFWSVTINSDVLSFYRNGILVYSGANSFTGLNTVMFYVLGRNLNNTIQNISKNALGTWGIGTADMNQMELFNSFNDLDNCLTSRKSLNVYVIDQSNGVNGLGAAAISGLVDEYREPLANANSFWKPDYTSTDNGTVAKYHTGINSIFIDNAGAHFEYTATMAYRLSVKYNYFPLIVNTSWNGTALVSGYIGGYVTPSSWNIGDNPNLYTQAKQWFFDRAKALNPKSNANQIGIMGVKEGDAQTVPNANAFQTNAQNLITQWRTDIGDANMPIVIIECPDLDLVTFPGRAIVQTAQAWLVANVPFVYLSSKADIVLGSSPHWTAATYQTKGLDLADQIATIIG